MTTLRLEILKHLQAALEFEEDAARRYKEFLLDTKESFGKIMFSKIAVEEERHAEIISAWIDKISSEPSEDSFFIPSTKIMSIKPQEIFRDSEDKPHEITKDYISAIKYSLKIEERSYAFYMKLVNSVPEGKLKDVFQRLADFEKEHIFIFTSEYNIVKNDVGKLLD
jgi:rubrerythrin